MRNADIATAVRILLVFPIAYLVLVRADPLMPAALLGLAIALDGVDGYFAVREASAGKVRFLEYVRYSLGSGNGKLAKRIKTYKARTSEVASYGPRLDVAGDRVIEYSMWVLFTYVSLVPLALVLLVIMRHSVVDALMGAKGTSSKLKTKFARVVYSSNFMRGGVNVVKFLAFGYLMFVHASGYPALPAYLLVALLFAMIMLRGAAEAYEFMHE